jgi:hypothetical protein
MLTEAISRAVTDDHVIENLHIEQCPGLNQLLGDSHVFRAWIGDTSRVIVGENNGMTVREKCSFEDLTRMDQGGGDGAMRDKGVPSNLQADIEVQRDKMLFRIMCLDT